MKQGVILLIVLIGVVAGLTCTEQQAPDTAAEVKDVYSKQLQALNETVNLFQAAVATNKNEAALRALFLEARKKYKATETFAEYYNPSTAKAINGPALNEVEPDNPEYPNPPSGFQVIETLLFPVYDTTTHAQLVKEAASLKAAVTRLNMVNEALVLTNGHILDAVRLEIFRIETLGLAGFDTPVCQSAIDEIPATLKSILAYLKPFKTSSTARAFNQLNTLINDAVNYALADTGFNHFNRAAYLVSYLNPLTKALNQFQEKAGIPYFDEPRPLLANASSLFEKNVFNAAYYTYTHKDSANNQLADLGYRLFNERRLSANATRSCASCHIEANAFTDGLAKNNTFDGKRVIHRNTPTILYAALQPALFADLRLSYLEDQAKQVVENPEEMHGNLATAAAGLSRDSLYIALFRRAFSSGEINAENIQKAIAAYIRTKSNFSSRFDEFMRGDSTKMNTDEVAGFNLFMSKAKCGTCHFMPLFNGNVPPMFSTMESEVLGVPSINKPPYYIDADKGRYNIINSAPYLYAFKTVTVRNSFNTAPYMHNGVFTSLEQVIDFYDKGGGSGLGIALENQTLPTDKLNLTSQEQKQLIAFIRTLSDQGLR